MEFSITALVLSVIILVFAAIGLLLGGFLVFNITVARFSRVELRSLVTFIFLGLLTLLIIALVLDALPL